MYGDITQDHVGGWFYRDNGDGTFKSLSDGRRNGETTGSPWTYRTVTRDTLRRPVVLIRNGQPTGHGDPTATKVAAVLHRRFA